MDVCNRRREGWEKGDVAFCQITLDTCNFIDHFSGPRRPIGRARLFVCLFVCTITFELKYNLWPSYKPTCDAGSTWCMLLKSGSRDNVIGQSAWPPGEQELASGGIADRGEGK